MPRRYKENKGEQQQVIEETPTTTTEAHLLPVKEPEQEPEACDAHSPLSLSRLEEVPEGRHNRPHNHHHHHRLFLAALAVVQNALVGGVLFGWNSVDRTLLAAPLINGGAGLSSTETTTVFSAASATAFVSALLLGLVLDRFGPRACSIVAHLAVALGFQLVAHATSHYKRYLLGFCLIAAGGPGIQASVVHVSNLYGSVRYAVLSGLTGSMTLSFLVLPLLEWMWHRYDVSLTTSFATYGLVVALSGMASYLCWPDHSFPSPTLHPPSQQPTNHPSSLWDRDDVEPTPEDEYVEAVAGHSCPTRTTDDEPLFPALPQVPLLHPRRRESDNGSENVPPVNRKDQSFAQQLCSAPYMRSVLFLAIACFWANLYVASLSTELADASSGAYDDNDDDDDDSAEQLRQRLSRRLTYILSSNCLVSFGVGYFMDHFGQPACAFVTLLWGQLHMVLILLANHNGSHNINDPTLLTLGFVAYGMFRQFLFPAFVAGLTHNLGTCQHPQSLPNLCAHSDFPPPPPSQFALCCRLQVLWIVEWIGLCVQWGCPIACGAIGWRRSGRLPLVAIASDDTVIIPIARRFPCSHCQRRSPLLCWALDDAARGAIPYAGGLVACAVVRLH